MLNSLARKLFNCTADHLKRFFNNEKKKNAKLNAKACSPGKSPDPPAVFGFERAKKIN
jgi:hypothetical protein